MNRMRGIWTWGLPALFLLCAAIIAVNESNIDVFFVINGISSSTGKWIWAVLTVLCDGLIAFSLFFPFIRRHPKNIWGAILAAVIVLMVSQILKRIWNMPRPPKLLRPQDFYLIGPDWGRFSFPSGHSAMAMILGFAFAEMVDKIWVRLLIILGVSLMALSRIVVGVHWPLDVLVGAALGWVSGWLGFLVAGKTTWGWNLTAQKIIGAVLLAGCIVLLALDYSGYGLIWEQRLLALAIMIPGLPEYLKLYGFRFKKLESIFKG